MLPRAKAATRPTAKAKRKATTRRRSLVVSKGRLSSRPRLSCVALRNSHSTPVPNRKKSEEQQRFGPSVYAQICGDEVVTSLELVWEIGDRPGESSKVLADCRETPI
jgi:hypothetical protein